MHGQVILNLFRRHYKETIRNCGFGKTLRIKLGERRHRKLTMLKARREAPGRIVERDEQGKRVQNPVKVRGVYLKGGQGGWMWARYCAAWLVMRCYGRQQR